MTQRSRTIVVFAVVALALVIVFMWNRHEREPQAEPAPSTGSGSATTTAAGAPPAPAKPGEKLRRIDKLARGAILERMRAARATDPASTTAAATVPRPSLPGKLDATDIRKGVRDLIPLLAECYDAALPRLSKKEGGIVFQMRFTGEPDVGTLVEMADISGDESFTKDTEMMDCFRETLLSIELPPTVESGDVNVSYPMTFSPE